MATGTSNRTESSGTGPYPVTPSEQLDFRLTLWRYQAIGNDQANIFDGERFHKVISWRRERPVLMELFESDHQIWMTAYPEIEEKEDLAGLLHQARQILGLSFDLQAYHRFIRRDRVLMSLAESYAGLRPTLFPNPFEMLIGSIAAQQINLKFAFKVKGQLTTAYGRKIRVRARDYYAFPAPEDLLAAGVDNLRALQLTRRKAEYIIGLCQMIVDGDLNLDALETLSHDEIVSSITAIRGLGRWTADWFMARGLGREAICPAGDLGVAKAIKYHYPETAHYEEAQLRDFSAQWGDHANLATHYLLKGWMERKQS